MYWSASYLHNMYQKYMYDFNICFFFSLTVFFTIQKWGKEFLCYGVGRVKRGLGYKLGREGDPHLLSNHWPTLADQDVHEGKTIQILLIGLTVGILLKVNRFLKWYVYVHTTSSVNWKNWYIFFPGECTRSLMICQEKERCEFVGFGARSISNQTYWCTMSSNGDGEQVLQKWCSVLNHVANVHGGLGPLFPRFEHGDIEDQDWIGQDI